VISQLLKAQSTRGNIEDMMMEGSSCVFIACREARRQEDINNEENANDKVYVLIHTM
jgi:hypothetical protein